jgi:hypothetical protein
MKDIIVKLLPIILVSVLFIYKENTIEFSHTILGRLVAVSIILFYISYNILYGLLACLLIILYYQFDFVEERSNLKIKMVNLEGFQEGAGPFDNLMVEIDKKIEDKISIYDTQLKTIKDDITALKSNDYDTEIINIKSDITNAKTDLTDFKTDVSNIKSDVSGIKSDISTIKADNANNKSDIMKAANAVPETETSGFTNYSDLYDELNPQNKTEFKEYFRKQNCKNGELKFKNITVKNEIAPHIFPELKYENEPCNPCSDTCNFSIIEEKINNEDALMKPVNSNDVVPKNVFNTSESNTIPSIGVVSEPFSSYK